MKQARLRGWGLGLAVIGLLALATATFQLFALSGQAAAWLEADVPDYRATLELAVQSRDASRVEAVARGLLGDTMAFVAAAIDWQNALRRWIYVLLAAAVFSLAGLLLLGRTKPGGAIPARSSATDVRNAG